MSPRRAPARISACELEVDGAAEDVLNRGEVQRTPLGAAPPGLRMVESLGLMWEEEKGRCGRPLSEPYREFLRP